MLIQVNNTTTTTTTNNNTTTNNTTTTNNNNTNNNSNNERLYSSDKIAYQIVRKMFITYQMYACKNTITKCFNIKEARHNLITYLITYLNTVTLIIVVGKQ